MSHYTSFAVAGVGSIGKHIVEALIAQPGTTVVALTRGGRATPLPAGVKGIDVDYSDKAALERALAGVQVVISTVSSTGLAAQSTLADAAKAAGVAIFVPSEFGLPTAGLTSGLLAGKVRVHDHVRSIGLPFTLYYTGLFADPTYLPWFGFDVAARKAEIVGTGNAPISWTTPSDIGTFVARTLTELAPERLAWAELRVEGSRNTQLELVKLLEAAHGVTLQVQHRDLGEVKRALGPDPGQDQIVDFIKVTLAEGHGIVGQPDNSVLAGFKPLTFEDAIKASSK